MTALTNCALHTSDSSSSFSCTGADSMRCPLATENETYFFSSV